MIVKEATAHLLKKPLSELSMAAGILSALASLLIWQLLWLLKKDTV